MSASAEVVVVGGGMAGCLSANYLADCGYRVILVEKRGVGTQASGNSAGGLNPLHGAGIPGPMSGLAMASFRLHQQLWQELGQWSQVDFSPRVVKRLFIAMDPTKLQSMEKSRQLYVDAEGFSAHFVDTKALLEIEPRINPATVGALYTEGNAAVDPDAYVNAIAEMIKKKGVTFLAASMMGIETNDNRCRVTTVLTDQGPLHCDQLVLATGAWIGKPSEWLGVPIPVEPLKGEMLLVKLPGPQLEYDVTLENYSIFYRKDGQAWIGATESREKYNNSPTEAAKQTLMEVGANIIPIVAEAKLIEQTSGLRPVTSDWLPIVGRASGWENVYLNTGAGKKGTLVSAGMAKAIADLISNGQTSVPIQGAEPDRFLAT
jgi:glycine oxidase